MLLPLGRPAVLHLPCISPSSPQVWCVHSIVVQPKVLSLKQRLALSKTLDDNKRLGKERVTSWRLGKSLEEVQWVFSTLCAHVTKSMLEAGLDSWNGEACAHFVSNCGLPQYKDSFCFNLTGAKLPMIKSCQLSQLGVQSHEHQKQIMASVRHPRQTARVWRRSTDFPLSPPHLPPPAPSSSPTSSTQNARILARGARSKLTPPPSCAGNIP